MVPSSGIEVMSFHPSRKLMKFSATLIFRVPSVLTQLYGVFGLAFKVLLLLKKPNQTALLFLRFF
jgi:hypothetical protein